MEVTVYNTTTGQITARLSCPESLLAANLQLDELYLDGLYDDSQYYVDVVTQQPVERPAMPFVLDTNTITADGTDMATLSGLPVGTTVRVRNQVIVVDDGALEFTSDVMGDFTFSLSLFPYRNAEVTVHAT